LLKIKVNPLLKCIKLVKNARLNMAMKVSYFAFISLSESFRSATCGLALILAREVVSKSKAHE